MIERFPREATSAVATATMRCSASRAVSTAHREWLLLLYADFALFPADANDGGLVRAGSLRGERRFTASLPT
jgi:hypothetical protein